MRYLPFIILTIFFAVELYAQNDFTAYNKIKLSVGASGQSLLVWSVPNIDNAISLRATPMFQASYDFVQANDIAVGIAGSYQDFNFYLVQDALSANIEATKYSFGVRGSYLAIDNQTDVLYIGGRFSLNIWAAYANGSLNLNSYTADYWWWFYVRTILNPLIGQIYDSSNNTITYSQSYSWLRFPLQFYLGYEHYFNKHIGYNFEAALGSPYLILGSITIKF